MISVIKSPKSQTNFIYLVNHRYISFALSTYAFSSYFNIRVYAKRDDFSFPIINFPFLNGDVPLTSLYVAYIPRLVRFQRICNNVSDFHDDFLVVLWQGDSFHKLQKTFTNLYYPHASLVYKYYSICQIYDQQGYFPSMLFMVT